MESCYDSSTEWCSYHTISQHKLTCAHLQLLKLGAVQGLPDLSDLYVIWDMDMIPTRHIPLMYLPSPVGDTGGASSVRGEAQLPLDPSIKSLRSRPVRTVVNIGGFWNRGYGESYEELFQRKCGPLPRLLAALPAEKSQTLKPTGLRMAQGGEATRGAISHTLCKHCRAPLVHTMRLKPPLGHECGGMRSAVDSNRSDAFLAGRVSQRTGRRLCRTGSWFKRR